MQGRAVEMARILCWYCKEAVLTGNKWGFVLLTSKSCTMLPSSITDVLGIIMDFEDNANARNIGKLHIHMFLSRFSKMLTMSGWGFLLFVPSAVSCTNFTGLVTAVGYFTSFTNS